MIVVVINNEVSIFFLFMYYVVWCVLRNWLFLGLNGYFKCRVVVLGSGLFNFEFVGFLYFLGFLW